jgi:hypothetical protein
VIGRKLRLRSRSEVVSAAQKKQWRDENEKDGLRIER